MRTLRDFLADLHYGQRQLRKRLGHTTLVVALLGVGLGANAAIFSLLEATLWRDLPYPQPDQLVRGYMTHPLFPDARNNFSYPLTQRLNEASAEAAAFAAFSEWMAIHLAEGNEQPDRAFAVLATGNFFDVLGAKAHLGRLFGPEDDVDPGGHPVLVLSHAYWTERFAADPDIVGRKVIVNGMTYTIIGVLGEAYQWINYMSRNDAYIPMAMVSQVWPDLASEEVLRNDDVSWLDMIGRLEPEASAAQVEAIWNPILQQRAAERAAQENNRELSFGGGERAENADRALLLGAREAAYGSDRAQRNRTTGHVLFGMVSLITLLALINSSSLLLVRAERRHKEMAIRAAVGATRLRLMRQTLTEGLLYGLLGAVLALFVAAWLIQLFALWSPGGMPVPLEGGELFTNPVVLAYLATLAIVASLGVSLAPALRLSPRHLLAAIHGNVVALKGRKHLRLLDALVPLQFALALVILVFAGLFLRTMQEAVNVDTGFPRDDALTAMIDIGRQGYDRDASLPFYREVQSALEAHPEIAHAAYSGNIPLSWSKWSQTIEVPGFSLPDDRPLNVELNYIGEGYFDALGVPLLRGDDFSGFESEDDEPVAIVNTAFVERFLGETDPLGAFFRLGTGEDNPQARIIGVVPSFAMRDVGEPADPMFYVPAGRTYLARAVLTVRGQPGTETRLPEIVRKTIRELDPQLPVFRSRTFNESLALFFEREQTTAHLLTGFGALALLLAAAGLYGVIAFHTRTRTREIGIRLALGAPRALITRMVLTSGLRRAGAGLLLGIGLALAGSPLIRAQLFGIGPLDPLTYAVTIILLTLTAILAVMRPALRAARQDPMVSLREE